MNLWGSGFLCSRSHGRLVYCLEEVSD
jgi:hypothetical protein